MKLLGWMHRKFRQNNGNDMFKDFSTGPTCNCLTGGPSVDDHHQLSPVLPARIHVRPMRDGHLSTHETLLFEGLLSIGTLGSVGTIEEEEEGEESEQEPQVQEPAIAVEAIAEKEETEEATETDLMVVSTELEKVLTEAAEKEGDSRLSSARPSHVSGKTSDVCPLQEYLFGSALEEETEKERKEKRASLGELFMIEEGGGKGGEEEKKGEKEKRVNLMMKMMLKKRGSQGSSGRSDGGGGGAAAAAAAGDAKDATTIKTAKFQKILQIFHRKIHPENDRASKKSTKSSKYKSKYNTSCDMQMTPSKRTSKKENMHGLDQPPLSLDGSDSVSSREHWIKTDADYLVLEL